MSEHAPRHEVAHTPEASSEQLQHHFKKPEQQAKAAAEATRSLEAIRHDIAERARSKRETDMSGAEQPASVTPAFVTRNLKVMARGRLLKQVRKHLPAQDRVFSRVIHQPVVDSVSEFAGKTIARPSGLLTGGICAFLGSGAFLYISKHYGYRYNFLLWGMFFVGGFVIGLLLEALLSLIARLRS